jgi:hypothetical protein
MTYRVIIEYIGNETARLELLGTSIPRGALLFINR